VTTFYEFIIFDDLVKSLQNDGFVKSSPAKAGLGAQKLRSEAHVQVRRNDEVAAQSRSERDRWTFYEVIKDDELVRSHWNHQRSTLDRTEELT
jgi:hypothetical protein